MRGDVSFLPPRAASPLAQLSTMGDRGRTSEGENNCAVINPRLDLSSFIGNFTCTSFLPLAVPVVDSLSCHCHLSIATIGRIFSQPFYKKADSWNAAGHGPAGLGRVPPVPPLNMNNRYTIS